MVAMACSLLMLAQADFPDPGLVEGRVVDEKGRPLAGATVRLDDGATRPRFPETKTEADGRFRLRARRIVDPNLEFILNGLRLRPGSVVATAPGRGLLVSPPFDENGGPLELALGPPMSIEGALRWPDGRPVKEARVEVIGFESLPEKMVARGVLNLVQGRPGSFLKGLQLRAQARGEAVGLVDERQVDDQGRFVIEGTGQGPAVHLEVTGPGLARQRIAVLMVPGIADEIQRHRRPKDVVYGSPFVHVVDSRPTVSGVVRDAKTRAPVVGATVGRSPLDFNDWEDVLTDEHGRYRFDAGPPFKINLRVTPPRAGRLLPAWRTIELVPKGPERTEDFELAEGAVLTGRVFDDSTKGPIVRSYDGTRERHGGMITYVPTREALRTAPPDFRAWSEKPLQSIGEALRGRGEYRLVVPPGEGWLFVQAIHGYYFSFAPPFSPCEVDDFPYVPVDVEAATKDRPTPLVRYVQHGAFAVEVPPGLAGKRQDLAIKRGARRTVHVVGEDGAFVEGALARGLNQQMGMFFHLKGHSFEVEGLGPKRDRLVLVRDKTMALAASAWLGAEGPPVATLTMRKSARVRARLVASPVEAERSGLLWNWLAPAPNEAGAASSDKGPDQDGTVFGERDVLSAGNRREWTGLPPGLALQPLCRHPYKDRSYRLVPDPGTIVLAPGEVRDLGDFTVVPIDK